MRGGRADGNGDAGMSSGQITPSDHELELPLVATSEYRIARVPEDIRSRDPEAYEPKAVCLGPYFHSLKDSPSFQRMQKHKQWCVDRLLGRSGRSLQALVQDFLLRLKQAINYQPLQQFYVEQIAMTEEEMGQMLLFDGCFTVHFLLRHDPGKRAEHEYWTKLDAGDLDEQYETLRWERPWEWGQVAIDMLLLENQIPFIVIRLLFDILRTESDRGIDLRVCACNMFSRYLPAGMCASVCPIHCRDVRCLLQLLYLSLLPHPEPDSRQREPPPKPPKTGVDPAKKLESGGVCIRRRQWWPCTHFQKRFSFLAIIFRDGALEIPQLVISDVSIQLLQNLIAFEKCYEDTTYHMTNYAAFMDTLNADYQDMEILRKRQILDIQFSPAQPGFSFRSRCKQDITPSPENYLNRLMVDVVLYKEARAASRSKTPMPDSVFFAMLVAIAYAVLVLYRYMSS